MPTKITLSHTVEIVVEPASVPAYEEAYREHLELTGLPITLDGFAAMIARQVADSGIAAAAKYGAKAYIVDQAGSFNAKEYQWD